MSAFSKNSSNKKPAVFIPVKDWNPKAIKFMQPRTNDSGGKAIAIVSPQTNSVLRISLPLLKTFGISDFVKDGESDGKFSISLVFPNEDYATPATQELMAKFKELENHLIDEATKNSEAWWGEEKPREVLKHTFYPLLKYSKDKTTKKIDYSKPPSIRAKVPNYDGKWQVELYDTKSNRLYPNENSLVTPIDLVPMYSQVACALQCGGIWIGGMGWGVTWKVVQCIVKPSEQLSVFGQCHIQLSEEEAEQLDNQKLDSVVDVHEDITTSVPVAVQPTSTHVEDSDDEKDPEPEPVVAKVAAPAEEAVVVESAPVKKVVKKTVAAADKPADAAPAATAKKVVKKKVAA